jgi:23S rRNA (adenine2503-C2)-methyltransferase
MSSAATRSSDHPLARLPEEWEPFATRHGGRAFHGKQVFRWIQARGVLDPQAMTDLPGKLREALAAEPLGVAELSQERRATDDTRKLLVRFGDGATVESVLIPELPRREGELPSPFGDDADASAAPDDDDDDDEAGEPSGRSERSRAEAAKVRRVTQCISTQVGCAMGCVFCASGVAGLKRHLAPEEIVAQVLLGRSRLEGGEQLRNVVYMGMGEPLHNYEATARSVRLLTHREGIGLSTRKVTISTSGLVPEIERLGRDFGGQIGLAISLHAADDETRSRLMPINRKYPLARLMEALRAYPLPKRRRITIEYTLVSGKNDTPEEARRLTQLLRGLPVKVNLIPMNPIAASPLGPPEHGRIYEFQRIVTQAGYSCFIRRRRGDDVSAACGQLALLGAKPKVRVDRT